ncbi:hypothetical protein ABKN59_006060 [Abortiporus biennis]
MTALCSFYLIFGFIHTIMACIFNPNTEYSGTLPEASLLPDVGYNNRTFVPIVRRCLLCVLNFNHPHSNLYFETCILIMRSSLIEQSSLVLRGFVVFAFIALTVEQAIQLGMAGSSALVIGAPLLAENAARGIPVNDHSLFRRRNPQLNDMTSDIAHDTSTEGSAASSTLAGVYSSVLATLIPGAFPTGSMAQEIPDHPLKSLPRCNPQLNDVTSDIAHDTSTEGTAASQYSLRYTTFWCHQDCACFISDHIPKFIVHGT